jgi:hypothetical protein
MCVCHRQVMIKKNLNYSPFFLETLTTDLGTCLKRRLICGANSCVKSLLHTKIMTSAHRHIEYTEMTTDSNSIWLLQHRPLHATERFNCFWNLLRTRERWNNMHTWKHHRNQMFWVGIDLVTPVGWLRQETITFDPICLLLVNWIYCQIVKHVHYLI